MKSRLVVTVFALLVIEFLSCIYILSYGQELRIMPLGNSITFDHNIYSPPYDDYNTWGPRISYRYKLYQLLTAAGYTFDFVGNRKAGFDYLPYEYADNAGFPGITAFQIINLLQTSYNDYEDIYEINYPSEQNKPYLQNNPTDVILLHIGTNDLAQYTVNEAVDNVDSVLDEIQSYEDANSVTIIVFVALIIDRAPADPETYLFNQGITTLINTRKSSGDKLELVNMYSGANIIYELEPAGDFVDTWHPNNTGFEKMADKWFQALEGYNIRPPIVYDIPDYTIYEGDPVLQINLNTYVFDPQEPDEDITWSYTPFPSSHFNISIANGKAYISAINPEINSSETFTFKAQDSGNGGTPLYDTDEATINYIAVNDIPQILNRDPFYVNEDSQIKITLDSLQVNDPDNDYPDDFTLHIQPGSNYTILSNYIVKPNNNYNGQLTVPMYVNDGLADSPVKNMTVNVLPVNDYPWINLPSVRNVNEDSQYYQTITANDIDIGDNLILSALPPFPGWLSFNTGTGKLSGIPDNDDVGNHTVKIRVFDGTVNVDSTFIIEVINTNDLPVFTSYPDITIIFTYETFEYFVTAIDIDPTNDILIYEVTEKPSWLSFDPISKKLSGMPLKKDTGINSVEIRVFDGTGYSYQNFDLTVKFTNHPPEITSAANDTAYEGIQYIYALKATDKESDPLIYSAITKPDWTDFYASGVLMGTPEQEDIGIYDVILSVSDGENIVYDSFKINVVNVNDKPVILGTTRPLNTPKETPLELSLNDLVVEDNDNIYPDDFTLKIQNGGNYTVIDLSIVPFTGYTGNLKVGVIVNDGLIDSDLAEIDVGVGTTSIPEHLIENSIVRLVYPNPAKDYIYFQFKNNDDQAIISFLDGSMRLIKKVIIPEGTVEVRIDIYEFNTGIVFYKIDYRNKYYSGKLVIE
jgi:hypothetical protein